MDMEPSFTMMKKNIHETFCDISDAFLLGGYLFLPSSFLAKNALPQTMLPTRYWCTAPGSLDTG